MSDEIKQLSSVTTDTRGLASSLAPVIIESCENRLSDIHWFKADWQRGGAATATASYRLDSGDSIAVVIKLPIVPRELMWTRRLQSEGDDSLVVPRLFASGDVLGGYDLAWIVIERFNHGPLGRHWHEDHVPRIAEAAARFHAAAAQFPVDQPPKTEDWRQLLKESQESIKINQLDHHKRWTTSIKALRHNLDALVDEWRSRDTSQWVHGDLHLANAMSRTSEQEGPVSLIDLAEVHAGNWIEDGVYLERQLWAVPDRLKTHPPIRTLAKARKALGLPLEDDYARLATIRRGLLASTAPKFIRSEGHPRYLEACLQRLETALQELK